MHRVMFYVQNAYGTGHLISVLRSVQELSCTSQVLVAYGGPELPHTVPENVHMLYLGKDAAGRLSGYQMQARKLALLQAFQSFQPGVLVTEHFPFGRDSYRFEILPLLDAAQGRWILSSYRGILGRDATQEKRMMILKDLEQYDAVLVHTDPAVTRAEGELPFLPKDKLVYTGFAVPQTVSLKERPFNKGSIIVHMGSGRNAARLLSLLDEAKVSATAYAGLLENRYEELKCKNHAVEIRPYSAGMIDELAQAGTIISTAGYNSASEALAFRAKSILFPVNREQQLRARDFARAGLAFVLEEPLEHSLSEALSAKLTRKPKVRTDGSRAVAEYISSLPQKKSRPETVFIVRRDQDYFESYSESGNASEEISDRLLQQPGLNSIDRASNLMLNRQEYANRSPVLRSLPTKVFVELTRNCNCCCRMCVRNSLPKYQKNTPRHDMPFGLFKSVADQLFSTAAEVDLRGFGETTAMPQFDKYLDYALRFDPQYMLVTNLAVRKDSLWKRLVKHRFILGISMDGATRRTYEHIRRGARFADVMHNLSLLKRLHARTFLLVCLQRDNLHELAAVVSLAARFSVPEVHINPAEEPEFSVRRMPKRTVSAELLKAFRAAEQNKVNLRMSVSLGIPEVEQLLGEPLQKGCDKPWSQAVVMHDGRVGPCDHWLNPPLVFGSLSSSDFVSIWNNQRFQNFRRTIDTANRFEKCDRCYQARYF